MIEPKKLEPGSELHFALLGTPMGWNFLTGKDYADMQAFAKAVWDAATERAAKEALKFSVSSHMMLHAGECTAGELRTGKAIANGIAAAIRGDGGQG